MKRLILAATAMLTLAAPLAAPAAFADPQRGYQYSDNRGNDRDGRYDRDDRRGDSRVVVHSKTTIWRDNRPNARWDSRVHNGYYIRNEWHYGQPSASVYRTRGFQLGYKPWSRGDRFGSYRDYREVDYRAYHLKAPNRGYHYVKDNNTGEIILAAIATGIIASIIAN